MIGAPSRAHGLSFDRTLMMGVVNVTPDSFSDGGRWQGGRAVERGLALFEQGADIVDIGGESTRPGAPAVSEVDEIARVVEVIRALRAQAKERVISIDTYKAGVAEAALDAGADIINDVSGARIDPRILDVAAARGATVILGHLRGNPRDMQTHATYHDVVAEVLAELEERVAAARARGVVSIWIDPGIGFSKTAPDSLRLIAALGALSSIACPIVVGASRKSFLGAVTGRDVDDREIATAAAHTAAILCGAKVVRVHDVALQRPAVQIADALLAARSAR